MKLEFKVDTKHRKDWFTGVSFSHPAKMSLPLQLWIIENYTKAGETILDPMAGSGTVLVACSLGRNVIAVELEQKFIDIMKGNWEKIKQRGAQLGYTFGQAQIIQGDARNLEGLLVDKCIFSPPFTSMKLGIPEFEEVTDKFHRKSGQKSPSELGMYHPEDPDNIGNLPYGEIDKCIFSPPYSEQIHKGSGEWSQSPNGKMVGVPQGVDYTKSPDNIANLPYGQIDVEIFSPPYEGSLIGSDNPKYDTKEYRERMAKLPSGDYSTPGRARAIRRHESGYSVNDNNIGNLKSQSYLEAMLQVYQQCFKVLRDGGLMVLVCKNFIRNKAIVRLDLDTIKLCEQAGFSFLERHYRVLPSQSFWRVIYHSKFPDVEQILKEDVLVFKKQRLL